MVDKPQDQRWSMESGSLLYSKQLAKGYLENVGFSKQQINTALGLGVGEVTTLEKDNYSYQIKLTVNGVDYNIIVTQLRRRN